MQKISECLLSVYRSGKIEEVISVLNAFYIHHPATVLFRKNSMFANGRNCTVIKAVDGNGKSTSIVFRCCPSRLMRGRETFLTFNCISHMFHMCATYRLKRILNSARSVAVCAMRAQ